jgi:hypothetical protein
MKPKLGFLIFLFAAASAATWFAARHLPALASPASADSVHRKVLYYQSPMHPWIKSDQPGKCPICGMNLVPVYDNGESSHTGFGLKLSSDSVRVAQVQSTTVQRRQFVRSLQVAGNLWTNSRTAPAFEFTVDSRDLGWLKAGQIVEVTLPSAPGKTYQAKIELGDSRPAPGVDLDNSSGGTKIRADISHSPGGRGGSGNQIPFNGGYAEGRVLVNLPEVLAVPRSAVLQPGAQPMVYLDLGKGYYEQREVKLGCVGDEFVEVLDGLQEGDQVVTSGNLLIDEEAQISQSANN